MFRSTTILCSCSDYSLILTTCILWASCLSVIEENTFCAWLIIISNSSHCIISMLQNKWSSDFTVWCLFQKAAVHISALFHSPQPGHLSLPRLPRLCHLSSTCPSKWSKWNCNKQLECEAKKRDCISINSERHNGVYAKTRMYTLLHSWSTYGKQFSLWNHTLHKIVAHKTTQWY